MGRATLFPLQPIGFINDESVDEAALAVNEATIVNSEFLVHVHHSRLPQERHVRHQGRVHFRASTSDAFMSHEP